MLSKSRANFCRETCNLDMPQNSDQNIMFSEVEAPESSFWDFKIDDS